LNVIEHSYSQNLFALELYRDREVGLVGKPTIEVSVRYILEIRRGTQNIGNYIVERMGE
jgi:hypothetical protein